MSPVLLPVHPVTGVPLKGELKPEEICPSCAKCCKYVCIEIDSPRSVEAVSNILWYLYHKDITVFEDYDGDWAVTYPGECTHLRPDGLCGIYLHRPLICRSYEVDSCEGTSPKALEREKFTDGGSFARWLKKRRPTVFARCKAKGIIPPQLMETAGPAGAR